jgi:hypothetical protein
MKQVTLMPKEHPERGHATKREKRKDRHPEDNGMQRIPRPMTETIRQEAMDRRP